MADNFCKDCNKQIHRQSIRCHACNGKNKKKHYYCRDCKAPIGRRTIRCLACHNKKQAENQKHCIDCDKVVYKEGVRCKVCRAKHILKEEEKLQNRVKIWAEKRRNSNG